MKPKRSYIFVRDLARGLADLLESPQGGCEAFNIGSHHEYNAEEILNLLSRISGQEVNYVSVQDRQRASDRPRLQPSLRKLEAMGWTEEFDMERGLREILSKRP
jgi:nucleoside-diphosphate-sugar epimerase